MNTEKMHVKYIFLTDNNLFYMAYHLENSAVGIKNLCYKHDVTSN